MQVIATALGFDGLQLRQVGEQFEMPGDPFKVHNDNHAKAVARHNKLLDNGKESVDPGDKPAPLWFRRANKEEVDHRPDTEVLPPVGSAAEAARNARIAAARAKALGGDLA